MRVRGPQGLAPRPLWAPRRGGGGRAPRASSSRCGAGVRRSGSAGRTDGSPASPAQLQGEVPRQRAQADAQLRDHLHRVGGGQRPGRGPDLGGGLQEGLHAGPVTAEDTRQGGGSGSLDLGPRGLAPHRCPQPHPGKRSLFVRTLDVSHPHCHPERWGKARGGFGAPSADLFSQRLVGQPRALTGLGAEVSRRGDPQSPSPVGLQSRTQKGAAHSGLGCISHRLLLELSA